MLTTKPHLLVRRPSPTTAEYTVTTAPAPTLLYRLVLLALLPLRLFAGVTALFLLGCKYRLHTPDTTSPFPSPPFPLPWEDTIQSALRAVVLSPPGLLASRAAAAIPTPVLIPLAVILVHLALRRLHVTERLLVLRGLGVQTSSSGGTYLSRNATRFIPTEKIRDVLINEAFRGFEVRHYLIVVVEGEEDVVVVFPRLLPRRHIVETVWRGVRGCLYEAEEGKG
ncbi:hypothetical protein ACRALDRAFT_2038475 [Sodiomyces alcalophilus JCM 7366]|uniref:uncharacterized protein n=1 Tax=Sodiomyces alcalophilus JCM 7366 TaxID=591952 RepID=UPI0039B3727C